MVFSKKDIDFLRYYIDEKERLKKEIDTYSNMLSTGYKAPDFTEIKAKNAASDDAMIKLVFKNMRIQKEIEKRLKKVEVIIIKSYKIINKIIDPELKTIVELRAIKGLTWEQIGEEVHMDASWTRRKYKNFIEN